MNCSFSTEDRLSANEAAVLAAVFWLSISAPDTPITVRAIADSAGLSLATTHNQLDRLKLRGLVTWEVGHASTLRPAVQIIEVSHG